MSMGKALALITTLLTVGLLGSQQTVPAQAQSADVTNLKREYRRPPPRPIENQALVDLGRDLFFEPRISASGKTSCASCHFPQLGWAVTDARSRNDSGKLTSRKSQPLLGLGYAGDAPVGWDGRSASLEAQAIASIATGSMSMREKCFFYPNSELCLTMSRGSRWQCRVPRSTSIRSFRRLPPSSVRWIRASHPSTDGWTVTRGRSQSPPSVASLSSRARRFALPAIAGGDSPTTSSTISAPQPPTRDGDVRSRMRRSTSPSRPRRFGQSQSVPPICTTHRLPISVTWSGTMKRAASTVRAAPR